MTVRRLFASISTPLAVIASLLAAPCVAAAPAASSGDVAWTVQTGAGEQGSGRGSFSYELEPGAAIADALVVTNTSTTALPLAVYAADAFTTAAGDIDLLTDPGASEGAGSWVHIDAAELTLQPGESADVPFTLSVPTDARPGDHAAGIVTSLVADDASQTLSVERRLGSRINVRVAGELVPAAGMHEVRSSYTASWNPFAPGTLTIDYSLTNEGNTRLGGLEAVTVSGPAGLLGVSTSPASLREIVPGSTIEVRRELEVVSLGWLAGSVEVEPEGVGIGGGMVAPITVDFSTPAVPWSVLLLLTAVAGIVVTVVVVVRRRARANRSRALPGDSGAQGQQV